MFCNAHVVLISWACIVFFVTEEFFNLISLYRCGLSYVCFLLIVSCSFQIAYTFFFRLNLIMEIQVKEDNTS